jgi:hypothetical protein
MIWHEEIVFASIAFEADQIEPWMRWHLVLEVKNLSVIAAILGMLMKIPRTRHVLSSWMVLRANAPT